MDDRTGLALSGGGVRSAAFNHGLLQALTQSGLIRWIDYLSTVSGGGYAGTYFTSLLCSDISSAKSARSTKRSERPLPGEQQEEAIKETLRLDRDFPLTGENVAKFRKKHAGKVFDHLGQPFARGGSYLSDPVQTANYFLIGFLFNLIFLGSGIVFIASTLAFIGRLPDWPVVGEWIQLHSPAWFYERLRDWSRPLIIPTAVFGLWLVVWVVKYCVGRLRRDTHRLGEEDTRLAKCTRVLAAFLAVSLLVAFAVFFGTADIDLTGLGKLAASDPDQPRTLTEHTAFWSYIPLVLVLLIAPHVSPSRLLRSERRAPSKWMATVLTWTGGALIIATFTSLVFFFAREDVSSYAANRDPDVVERDISDAMGLAVDVSDPNKLDLCTPLVELNEAIRMNFESTFLSYRPRIREAIQEYLDANKETFDGRRPKEVAERERLIRNLDAYEWDHFITALTPLYAHKKRIEAISRGEQVPEYIENDVLANMVWPLGTGDDTNQFRAFCMELEELLRLELAYAVQKALVPRDGVPPGVYFDRESEPDFLQWMKDNECSASLSSLYQRAVRNDPLMSASEKTILARAMLEASYPKFVAGWHHVRRMLVWNRDTTTRLYWMAGSLFVFLSSSLLVNLNANSLHNYYRSKLGSAFIAPDTTASTLLDLSTTKRGGPYHLWVGALNILERWPKWMSEFDSTYTYVFSQRFCGSESMGYMPTKAIWSGKLDLASVMAISGAAFTPAFFRARVMAFMMLVFNLRLGQWLPTPKLRKDELRKSDEELGNGKSEIKDAGETGARKSVIRDGWNHVVTPWQVLMDRFFSKAGDHGTKAESWRYSLVTDGGHNDNLGLAPLLLRRCRLIIVSDASQDASFRFDDFMKIYVRCRVRIQIPMVSWSRGKGDAKELTRLDFEPLCPIHDNPGRRGAGISHAHQKHAHKGLFAHHRFLHETHALEVEKLVSKQHFILLRVIYPETDADGKNLSGLIVYIKPTMNGDEPIDLMNYFENDEHFPHDPTADQLFTEKQVEAYRQLGEHIGSEFCGMLLGEDFHSMKDLWDTGEKRLSVDDICRLIESRYERYGQAPSTASGTSGDVESTRLAPHPPAPMRVHVQEAASERDSRDIVP
ncbi:MAG: hypothetical protein U1D30_17755 [Planctomycetota bacterium]